MAACPASSEPSDVDGSTTTTIAVADSTPGPPPETTTTVPDVEFEIGSCEFIVPEDRTAQCGWLEVPAQWDDPSGDTIRLHVARFRSESDAPAPDAVVYLEGGPGGDALETLQYVFEDSFAHLLADRDVIFFDQRGTGYSEPSLACPEVRELGFELIDQVLEPQEYVDQTIAVLSDCRDRLVEDGADLTAYNSAASASDLDALRRALGYEEWNLYGISYGTRLAQTVMRDHPGGIRSVILDSTYPIEADLYVGTPGSLDEALTTLFEGCAADPACDAAYPELEQVFYDTLEELDANPVRAPVTDIHTGTQYDAVFDGTALAGIVFQSLYSAEIIPILPRLITDVSQGELYELSLLATTFAANGEFVSIGMQYSVQCNEEAVFSNREATEAAIAEVPRLQSFFEASINIGPVAFDVCDFWGAGVADDLENEAITSDIPTLVLAGEYDPITPPDWGSVVAGNLGSATYVEMPGVAHGPSASEECPQGLVRAFLGDPTGDLDTSCVDDMGAPVFETPGSGTTDVTLVPYSMDWGGVTMSGVIPEGWDEAGPGVWARLENGLDQTALIQQFAPGMNVDGLLGILLGQLGLEEIPDVSETYGSPIGEWSIYESELAGTPSAIALVEANGGVALVLLTASPHDYEGLKDALLYPVLDSVELQ